MVMVIHNLLLRMCPPPLGQSEPAQLTTPLLCHLKYTAFLWKAPLIFLEREEVMAMVRQGLLFKSFSSGKGKGWDHGHTEPSFGKLSFSSGKGKE